jgi:hypothetical protein
MIAAKTMGANVVSQNNKSCTGGEATKKREIPAQQKQGEIQVKIIALAAAVIVAAVVSASAFQQAT